MIHNIPQPVFEQFVTDYLARDPNVDIRKGVSFVSLDQVLTLPPVLPLQGRLLTSHRMRRVSPPQWKNEQAA